MPTSISEPDALPRRRPAEPERTREAIRRAALAIGFDDAGFADPGALDGHPERLARFLAAGRHGGMAWLAEKVERRASPRALWPEVATVLVVAANYGPHDDPLKLLALPERGSISVYARGRDYHDVLKGRLKRLAQQVAHRHATAVKVFVDTAPVPEKPLARAAGLGWQGKHTNLVSRRFGSWLFLGAVYMALRLPPDEAAGDRCGSCRRCLDACPTDAFPAPYQLDARRCISYLTIEHAGHIAPEFRAAIGNRIYGCDDCLAACPWNKYAAATAEPAFLPRVELTAPKLADLALLDDAAFRQVFAGSPIKRIGRDRFVRNVLIAIGNSGHPELAERAERLLGDASPPVRAMAVWALGRLLPEAAVAALAARHAPAEPDPAVGAEWAALTPP